MDALKCHEIYRCISSRSQPGESRGGCLAAISRFIGGTFSRSIARPVDFQPGRPGLRMKNLQKGKRNVEILEKLSYEGLVRAAPELMSFPVFSSLSSQIRALFSIRPRCVYREPSSSYFAIAERSSNGPRSSIRDERCENAGLK